MARGKIDWDEVFEKYTKDKVLQVSYSAIARELGVSEKAVRRQFKKRGVIDPRKVRSLKSEYGSDSDIRKKLMLQPDVFNNLKHGLYARVFWTKEGKQLYENLIKSGRKPDIVDAIYMIKAKIASGEISKIKDVLNALEIMSKLYDKVLGAERNDIERQRLEHEAEKVRIMREKLELEKASKNISDEDEIELVLGENNEDTDQNFSG